LADLQTVTKRLENLAKDVKRVDKHAIKEAEIIARVKDALSSEQLANSVSLYDEEKVIVRQLNLLTAKPFLYILNKKAGAKNLDEIGDERFLKLISFFKARKDQYVIVDAKIEEELGAFEGDEKKMFATELGVKGDGIDELIVASYKLLGLMTYFTTGVEETRAWTIHVGSTAPIAGMAIHTDFKEKFIRAEIINWKVLLDTGSYSAAKEKGLVRTEGKDYIVQDGDVIEFKI
jgi:ribosome-binding ATPase YchF (GTP1/OBG family)